jgi:DNA repair protein RecO (recombination protein O)
MYYQSRSIILRNRDLRDSDQILAIFTEKEGKITAVAKGVKKPKSSLRACTQPFCHSLLYFSRGREMDLLTQGKIIDFYGDAREDMTRTLYAMYLMELLDKSLLERVPLPHLYGVAVQVLEHMSKFGLNLMLIRYFESRLLVSLGYRPVLNQCVHCGSQALEGCRFSLQEGGILCAACGGEDLMTLGGETAALLRLLSAGAMQTVVRVKASPQAMRQLELLLERYLEYHLERRFKVKNTIRILKQTMPVSN